MTEFKATYWLAYRLRSNFLKWWIFANRKLGLIPTNIAYDTCYSCTAFIMC